jgi:serralysin
VGAEIDFSLSTSWPFSSSSTWAIGFFPDPRDTAYLGQPGDIFLNVNSGANFLPTYAPGSQGWFLFLHEIGHTLGLKHPHDDGGTGRPTLDQIGLGLLNDDWGTVMSYNDDFNWNSFSWDPATPMLLDVIALQYIYGPNMSTNAGDTLFQLSRINAYLTYWDASGTDTVDASSSFESWTIVLPRNQISSLVSTKGGLAAPTSDFSLTAPTTLFWLAGDIENARGSSAGDAITGSDGANRLEGIGGDDYINGYGGNDTLIGGAGNDTIDGGGGFDVACLSGMASSYQTNVNGATRTMQGQDGFDTYTNVFRFHFDNVSVAYDVNGDAGEAYRLYQAAFDRTPDLSGLGFWITALDNGSDLHQVAGYFLTSAESVQKYGVNPTTQQFVTQLYANVLHRAPDPSGEAYWENALVKGLVSRADALAFFSESSENQANVIGAIQNGIVYTV